jgi:hypothetical protein
MFQKEIERIIWIHVDEDQIHIVHDQLAESETIISVGHVISGADIFHRPRIRPAKSLNNFLAFDSHRNHLAVNVGGRQDLFKIKD